MLLLWDRWISYNSEFPVAVTEVDSPEIIPPINEEPTNQIDLPSVNKLESKRVAPLEEKIETSEKKDVVILENSVLKIGINTLGGVVEFAELQNQKSEDYPDGKV